MQRSAPQQAALAWVSYAMLLWHGCNPPALSCLAGCPSTLTQRSLHRSPPTSHPTGVGRLILDILHALSEGHDASGHEVQGAVSPSLLLLVRRREGGADVECGCAGDPHLLSWSERVPTCLNRCARHLGLTAAPPQPLPQGAPGTGKTTLLRDIAHLLSDTFQCVLGSGASVWPVMAPSAHASAFG